MLLRDFVKIVSLSKRNYFPVIDSRNKNFCGMVNMDEIRWLLFDTGLDDVVTMEQIMDKPGKVAQIDDNLKTVLQMMQEKQHPLRTAASLAGRSTAALRPAFLSLHSHSTLFLSVSQTMAPGTFPLFMRRAVWGVGTYTDPNTGSDKFIQSSIRINSGCLRACYRRLGQCPILCPLIARWILGPGPTPG
jgi:hypothetical protein